MFSSNEHSTHLISTKHSKESTLGSPYELILQQAQHAQAEWKSQIQQITAICLKLKVDISDHMAPVTGHSHTLATLIQQIKRYIFEHQSGRITFNEERPTLAAHHANLQHYLATAREIKKAFIRVIQQSAFEYFDYINNAWKTFEARRPGYLQLLRFFGSVVAFLDEHGHVINFQQRSPSRRVQLTTAYGYGIQKRDCTQPIHAWPIIRLHEDNHTSWLDAYRMVDLLQLYQRMMGRCKHYQSRGITHEFFPILQKNIAAFYQAHGTYIQPKGTEYTLGLEAALAEACLDSAEKELIHAIMADNFNSIYAKLNELRSFSTTLLEKTHEHILKVIVERQVAEYQHILKTLAHACAAFKVELHALQQLAAEVSQAHGLLLSRLTQTDLTAGQQQVHRLTNTLAQRKQRMHETHQLFENALNQAATQLSSASDDRLNLMKEVVSMTLYERYTIPLAASKRLCLDKLSKYRQRSVLNSHLALCHNAANQLQQLADSLKNKPQDVLPSVTISESQPPVAKAEESAPIAIAQPTSVPAAREPDKTDTEFPLPLLPIPTTGLTVLKIIQQLRQAFVKEQGLRFWATQVRYGFGERLPYWEMKVPRGVYAFHSLLMDHSLEDDEIKALKVITDIKTKACTKVAEEKKWKYRFFKARAPHTEALYRELAALDLTTLSILTTTPRSPL